MIHAILIINKAGGLIYNKDFGGISKLTSNEYLVLAGTFHGIHAITAQLSPNGPSSGIQSLSSESLNIHCFQTLTGIKFILISDTAQTHHDAICDRVYKIYSDYAMKNPFYNPEMPIRAELFDSNVAKLVKSL